VLAYLELLQEGQIAHNDILTVGFDLTPEITQAINAGRLLGTVTQDPEQLGQTSVQELIAILQQNERHGQQPAQAKQVLVPVKKVTKQALVAGKGLA
jgi:ABC-type sugar transport system substrate-binding protein